MSAITSQSMRGQECVVETSELDPVVSTDVLLEWVAGVIGEPVADWHKISGGNRYQSFIITAQSADTSTRRYYLRYQLPRTASVEPYTVLREIAIYNVLEGSDVPAARLIAVNPSFPAILMEHIEGIAEYRRLTDRAERETIAIEFVDALARLHSTPFNVALFSDAVPRRTLADCARAEIADWKAMYQEVSVREPLIEFSIRWLEANVQDVSGEPVLCHGDAGPGNFLFKDGHLSALIDWEFAHTGDWHDDLAWFSMRCVMEPVPDFTKCLRRYEELTGKVIDLKRLQFYQVLVSTRVLIIRHRNVSGEYGNSIVSQALNRRLLTAALASANNLTLPELDMPEVPPTDRTKLYDYLITSLRDDISLRINETHAVAASKNAAKIAKFLREIDRYGPLFESRETVLLHGALERAPKDKETGYLDLATGVAEGRIDFLTALQVFTQSAQCGAILAAAASGSIAGRTWPSIE